MSGLELYEELSRLLEALRDAVPELRQLGIDLAKKEAEYKVVLMQMSLRLRDQGMPATLINQVVYGYVADERQKRDVAEVMYKTQQEAINGMKLRAKLMDEQIKREWGNQ